MHQCRPVAKTYAWQQNVWRICEVQVLRDESGQPPAKEQAYPRPAYAWYVVVVLTIAYVVSFLDRQILALLVEPIKHDLGISDTRMSLLLGFAFALFYTLLGIPAGRLADRLDRRWIITGGITLWSIMTGLCGLARDYSQLFLARIGVGVGEATLNPAALSLISDYFPPASRARPLGFFAMGVSVGAGCALVAGGWLIETIAAAPPVSLPLVGTLYPWQTVFLVLGIPGLLVAALMGTVREPQRHGRLQRSTGVDAQLGIREALGYLRGRWRGYAGIVLGMSGATLLGYGFLSWLPALFMRTWGWSIAQVALVQGLVLLTAGPISVYAAGWFADVLSRRGDRAAHLRVFTWLAGVMTASAVALSLAPGPWWAAGFFFINVLGSAGLTAVATAGLMLITPNQLRGQASAIYYFTINVTGLTLGPVAVAVLTDHVFEDEAALRYSMALVGLAGGLFASIAAWRGVRAYADAMLEARSWSD